MRVLYALSVTAGLLLLVAWTVVRAVGKDTRAVVRLPPYIAVTMAFGLAGLSASYAGWPTAAAVAAAVLASLAAFGWVRGTRTVRKS